MRVAHLAVVTPSRCGLYETTRELVAGLRARGVDSRIVDPLHATNKLHPGGADDRGAALSDMTWALEADVIVSHSGVGPELEATDQPLVHVAHGRPRSSILSEFDGTAIYSHMYTKNREGRCKAVVSFWPEHEPYLRVIFKDTPVHTVQAPVDLDAWSPDGPDHYAFGGHRAAINVVCTDMWRRDVDPFIAINAFALWARQPGFNAKLHLYGVTNRKPLVALLKTLQDDGTLGQVLGHVQGLANVYRAATCSVTSQSIATRSVRESLACGCPVVRLTDPVLNGFGASFMTGITTPRQHARANAVETFDPVATARQFHAILDGVV